MTGVLAGAFQIKRRIRTLFACAAIVQLFRGAYVPFKDRQRADGIDFISQWLDCFTGLDSNVCDHRMRSVTWRKSRRQM